jgi:hypothetical protein
MVKKAVLALVFVLTGPGVAAANGPGSDTVELTMSNFRYCAGASCTPADQGYLRSNAGPVPGADNPHAEGLSMGAARSRSGEATITAAVNQNRGALIRYFCSINDHYQLGMTGILRVV